MSHPIIRVENLSKKYIVSHQQEGYTTFREALTHGVRSLSQKLMGKPSLLDANHEDFWALKDVNFEIQQGDRVGIIGRNGAGKSTLLKILSRITEPTSGSIQIGGRVASLLEVGTGFHPELTGRENIFLNGAILGMSKVEIKRKFDEIVDFAEIEKFLDTPVKRYSSGMYVRLAFAVAAHLEPEILIVDEVLAVGDIAFQKKCIGKMDNVATNEGRTVLFVSHNMSAVQALCERCLVFQSGQLIADEKSAAAAQIYLQNSLTSSSFSRPCSNRTKPSIVSGRIKSFNHELDPQVLIELNLHLSVPKAVSLDVRLTDREGVSVGFGSFGTLDPKQMLQLQPGTTVIGFSFSTQQLAVGTYLVSLDLTEPDKEFYDRAENCLSFDVIRRPEQDAIRVLKQSWGYGSFEIPLVRVRQHVPR